MRYAFAIGALLGGCEEPHADFATPPGVYERGAVLGPEASLDNLVLNPNFTLPWTFVNSVGVSMWGWPVAHVADSPTGQPVAIDAGTVSFLVRLVPEPLEAEVWVSGPVEDPFSLDEATAVLTFTDPVTLEDREVPLMGVEERVIGAHRWGRLAARLAGGQGLATLVVQPGVAGAMVSAPVVRPAIPELRSPLPVGRPADPRWRPYTEMHRPGDDWIVP